MVLRPTCPPGELLGQRYSRLGRCPHKGAFWSEQRIVLSLLHGAQLFIGFDVDLIVEMVRCWLKRRGRYSGGRWYRIKWAIK
jgi:hypothetical protein